MQTHDTRKIWIIQWQKDILLFPNKENADALLSDMMSNVGSDPIIRSIQSIEAPGADTLPYYMLEEAEVENLKNDSESYHIELNPR